MAPKLGAINLLSVLPNPASAAKGTKEPENELRPPEGGLRILVGGASGTMFEPSKYVVSSHLAIGRPKHR